MTGERARAPGRAARASRPGRASRRRRASPARADLAFAHAVWALHRRIVQICRNDILREVSLGLLELLDVSANSIVPGTKTPAYKRNRIAIREAKWP